MSTFNPENLTVTVIPPATPTMPADGRKYTLTHSDTTGELFLSIGKQYDFGKIDEKIRDEVLAEWGPYMGVYVLSAQVYISGGEFDQNISKVRYLIFKKEIDFALEAIMYGDREFFRNFPWLLDSPITVQFNSVYPEYQKLLLYGTPRQYLNGKNSNHTSTIEV
ncbi:staygreen family protein [Peribacillus glennii]|uniref:Staygreen protein domain-containing protein n=1 Tax=Peribacillus glennii TaxID=2303991 RepID=A0A372L6D7_9BACI|nr:staygreen family protein [Peribacillus glennii]RFU60572.1 hypothetical protein D0466_21380 [Peribacillus glennii]